MRDILLNLLKEGLEWTEAELKEHIQEQLEQSLEELTADNLIDMVYSDGAVFFKKHEVKHVR